MRGFLLSGCLRNPYFWIWLITFWVIILSGSGHELELFSRGFFALGISGLLYGLCSR